MTQIAYAIYGKNVEEIVGFALLKYCRGLAAGYTPNIKLSIQEGARVAFQQATTIKTPRRYKPKEAEFFDDAAVDSEIIEFELKEYLYSIAEGREKEYLNFVYSGLTDLDEIARRMRITRTYLVKLKTALERRYYERRLED